MEIVELPSGRMENAAAVLGRGMRDNPLHGATFGEDPQGREVALTRLFSKMLVLNLPKGAILGAFEGPRLVGVCGMIAPGRCRLRPSEKIRMLPVIVTAIGPRSLSPMLRWAGEWAKRDPDGPHWHLGPVGVERELQGQGIGSAMLREFCARVDRNGDDSYLETDKAENVAFYEKFGFRVVDEAPVLGTKNWFMWRPARVGASPD